MGFASATCIPSFSGTRLISHTHFFVDVGIQLPQSRGRIFQKIRECHGFHRGSAIGFHDGKFRSADHLVKVFGSDDKIRSPVLALEGDVGPPTRTHSPFDIIPLDAEGAVRRVGEGRRCERLWRDFW